MGEQQKREEEAIFSAVERFRSKMNRDPSSLQELEPVFIEQQNRSAGNEFRSFTEILNSYAIVPDAGPDDPWIVPTLVVTADDYGLVYFLTRNGLLCNGVGILNKLIESGLVKTVSV